MKKVQIYFISFLVYLMRDSIKVGTGRIMPDLNHVHNYQIKNGWVVVCVNSLKKQDLPFWKEFPTGSGVIEEGSFSAWPEKEIRKSITFLLT